MVELKDLAVGSVVVDCRGGIGIVMDITNRPKYPVTYAVKASGSRYKADPGQFRCVVGKIDVEAFKAAVNTPLFPLVESGLQSMYLPESLKGMNLKVGDKIVVKHGYKTVEAVFEEFIFTRPKYPVTYSINGKRWKGKYESIVSKVAA